MAMLLKSAPVLNSLAKFLDLVDIEAPAPLKKEISFFFSTVHGSFTRTDYMLVDSGLVSNV